MFMSKQIPFEKFNVRIETPPKRNAILSVHILENGNLNFNGKLAAKLLGKTVNIRFTPDYKHLCIYEGDEIIVPKNGSCKLYTYTQELKANKIALPAFYNVWLTSEKRYWQGDLLPNPLKRQSKKQASSATF